MEGDQQATRTGLKRFAQWLRDNNIKHSAGYLARERGEMPDLLYIGAVPYVTPQAESEWLARMTRPATEVRGRQATIKAKAGAVLSLERTSDEPSTTNASTTPTNPPASPEPKRKPRNATAAKGAKPKRVRGVKSAAVRTGKRAPDSEAV